MFKYDLSLIVKDDSTENKGKILKHYLVKDMKFQNPVSKTDWIRMGKKNLVSKLTLKNLDICHMMKPYNRSFIYAETSILKEYLNVIESIISQYKFEEILNKND